MFHLTSFEIGHLYLIDMRHDISLTLLFQLYTLRKLNQGDAADPRAPLSGNFRPIQALNGRTIRTNIFLAPAEENEVRHNCHHVCFCISYSDLFQDATQCPTIQENVEYKCK